MRLKLGLLLALIRPFQLLLLDEPTSALDRKAPLYCWHGWMPCALREWVSSSPPITLKLPAASLTTAWRCPPGTWSLSEVQAVWLVRSRQIARKLTWWLTLLGYDPHDHSLAHRIYLVYASLFWGIWFFAVFSLFAGPATTVLTALGISPLNQAAVVLSLLALLSWGLFKLWQATRRSPLVFSENDAYLICQAPVPGSSVAVSWLLGDWFEAVAPFWIGAVTLSIALVDYGLEGKVSLADLPTYLLAGLQALLGITLAHFGLMALVWAAGALRLQRDRQLRWQPTAARLGIASCWTGTCLRGVSLWSGRFKPAILARVALAGPAPAPGCLRSRVPVGRLRRRAGMGRPGDWLPWPGQELI